MFDLQSVSVTYGERPVLKDVTATLGPGSVCIVGPSGSGKSTLLRVLAGHQSPDEGTVLLGGTAVATRKWKRGSDPRIAFIFQDYRLIPFLSAAENLLLAAEIRGVAAGREGALDALFRVGLDEDHADRLPKTLSGGEQQRVAIARALMCGASALVADEPTGALDSTNSSRVAEQIVTLGLENDVQVIVATHDPVVADMLPHRYHLADGILKSVNS